MGKDGWILFGFRQKIRSCNRGKNMVYYTHRCAGLLRIMLPKGIGMRKVRASQGRITDNVRRRQLPGKCNRDRLPLRGVQVERRGKSSPARQVTVCKCKPYPKQHRKYSGHSPMPARQKDTGGLRHPATGVPDR